MNIKQHVETFQPVKKLMEEGEAYYRGKNTAILNRRKEFYNTIRSAMQEDYTKANNQLASGFAKMIVDQKVNYSINNDLSIEDQEQLENLLNINKFKRMIGKVAKNASNEIYGVIQWYIEEGELKHKIVPSQQIIIVRDPSDYEIITHVIRTYKIDDDCYADVYDNDEKAIFKLDDGKYVIQDRMPNLVLKGVNQGDVASSWGKPPFSVMYNNDEMQRDLDRFKRHTDCYDFVQSDLCNNLEDFNEAYWVLKGFSGQDPEEFVEAFKKSRVAMVGEGGEMSQESREIPYQARETTLKLLKRDIFRFAQAVDPEDIQGDVTNVAIESMYSQLDLKANDFEIEVQDFVDGCMYFINKYAELTSKTPVEAIELKFDRSIIMNKDRMIELSNQSVGSVSDKTRWEYDPRVKDTEEEKDRMAEEQGVTLV